MASSFLIALGFFVARRPGHPCPPHVALARAPWRRRRRSGSRSRSRRAPTDRATLALVLSPRAARPGRLARDPGGDGAAGLARLAAAEPPRLGARLSLRVRGALRRGQPALRTDGAGRRSGSRSSSSAGIASRPAPAAPLERARGMTAARKAVILARGLGSRMRREDAAAALDPAPGLRGRDGRQGDDPDRPAVSRLRALRRSRTPAARKSASSSGPSTAPCATTTRSESPPRRIRVAFAVQDRPLGTADALLAAEAFAGGEDFLVVNSDNYYPVRALARSAPAVRARHGAFRADGAARAQQHRARPHAVVRRLRRHGRRIPRRRSSRSRTRRRSRPPGPNPWISMNCWRFSPAIFEPCRATPLSPRGEKELPRAVDEAVAAGRIRIRVLRCRDGVLDLSRRADIASVAERLRGVEAVADEPPRRSSRPRSRPCRRGDSPATEPLALVRAGAHRGPRQAHRLRRRAEPPLLRRAGIRRRRGARGRDSRRPDRRRRAEDERRAAALRGARRGRARAGPPTRRRSAAHRAELRRTRCTAPTWPSPPICRGPRALELERARRLDLHGAVGRQPARGALRNTRGTSDPRRTWPAISAASRTATPSARSPATPGSAPSAAARTTRRSSAAGRGELSRYSFCPVRAEGTVPLPAEWTFVVGV